MHTISFSPVITRVLRVVSTEGVLGLLLICLISCGDYSEAKRIAEVEVKKEKLVLNPAEGKWYHEGKAFDGYAVDFFPEGSLAEKIGYYHGKKEGLAQKWYIDGTLKYEAYYKQNRKEGKLHIWSQNKVLIQEANFIAGITHGTQRQWYPSGKPFKETNFNMGKEEGIQKGWLESGGIFANYEAKNGRFFGLKRANACYELKSEVVQF